MHLLLSSATHDIPRSQERPSLKMGQKSCWLFRNSGNAKSLIALLVSLVPLAPQATETGVSFLALPTWSIASWSRPGIDLLRLPGRALVSQGETEERRDVNLMHANGWTNQCSSSCLGVRGEPGHPDWWFTSLQCC